MRVQSTSSILNWNLQTLVFEEKGKLEYLDKNLLKQKKEPIANSTYTCINPGTQTQAKLVESECPVSALCHPCNPFNILIRYTVFLFLSSFYSYIFWLGDFNYRINETIENIKGLCGKQEYSALWPHDQVFKYILYIYIVMYSVPLLYCGSSTVIKEVDHHLRMA